MTPALVTLAALLQAVWTMVLVRGDLTHGALPGTLGLLGVADVIYLAALGLVVAAIRSGRAPLDDGRALALVAVTGVAFRLTLLPLEPTRAKKMAPRCPCTAFMVASSTLSTSPQGS